MTRTVRATAGSSPFHRDPCEAPRVGPSGLRVLMCFRAGAEGEGVSP